MVRQTVNPTVVPGRAARDAGHRPRRSRPPPSSGRTPRAGAEPEHSHLRRGDVARRDQGWAGWQRRTGAGTPDRAQHSDASSWTELAGTLGLRELTLHKKREYRAGDVRGPDGRTGRAGGLVGHLLTDGRTHAVMVVDDCRQIIGIIIQTDLLATLTQLLSAKTFTPHEPQLAEPTDPARDEDPARGRAASRTSA